MLVALRSTTLRSTALQCAAVHSPRLANVRALTWGFACLTALLYVMAFATGCPKGEAPPMDDLRDIIEDTCIDIDSACDEERPCCAGTYCAQWVNVYLEEPHACQPLEAPGTYCIESTDCASGECADNICTGDVTPVEPEPEAEPICAAEAQPCTTVTCCDGLVCVATADSALCEPEDIAPTCAEQGDACDGDSCCDGLGCFNGSCVTAPAACESEWDCDGLPCTEGHCDACGTDGDNCYGSGGCCDGQYCRITGYIDGVCEAVVPLGETCTLFASCATDLFCDEGVCAAPYEVGDTCPHDYVCASQFCDNGACATLLGASTTCTAAHHCASGACVSGQCE